MPISLDCPRCGKHYELGEALAGRRARCKQCDQVFTIPDPPRPAVKTAPRSAPLADFDDVPPPPPPRPAARPARARRKLEGRLPAVAKAWIILVGTLCFMGALILTGLGVARGESVFVVVGLVMFGVAAVVAAVNFCFLKVIFITAEESQLEALAVFVLCWFPGIVSWLIAPDSQLLGPLLWLVGFLLFLVAVVRRWEASWRYFCGYLAGSAALVVLFIVMGYQLSTLGRAGAAAPRVASSGPGSPALEDQVVVVVTGIPSVEANQVIREKLRRLADPGGGSSLGGEFLPGRPGRYTLWPVRDPRAFAARVDFGRVTKVVGREVTIAADRVTPEEVAALPPRQPDRPAPNPPPAVRPPEPEVPADADPVTRSLAGLKSPDEGRRKRAVQELARMAPVEDRREEVHEALRSLLEEPDGFLVTDVIKAMASWSTPETVPALIVRTTDDRFGVRWQAIETLGRLKDARAAEAIAARLKEDGIKAEPALRALGPAAEPAVLALLRSHDPDIRRRACDVLRDIGGKETLDYMLRTRADPDLGVRMAARGAMEAIAGRVGRPGR